MSAVVDCPACHESLELPDEFLDGVVCPHCEAAFVMKPVLLPNAEAEAAGGSAGTTAAVDSPNASSAAAAGKSSPASGASVADKSEDAASSAAEISEEKSSTSEASAWAGVSEAASGGSQESGDSSISAKAARHRQKKGPGLLVQAIGVFGGGAVGLYLGYWLLNFFGGQQFYFVKLPLPFVEHASPRSDEPGDFPPPPPDGGPITIEGPRRNPRPRNRTSLPNNDSQTSFPAIPGASSSGGVITNSSGEESTAGRLPRYTTQELVDALTETDRLTNAAVDDTIGRVLYRRLCHLAEVVTFVDANDKDVYLRRQAVDTIFRRVTDRPEKLAAINAWVLEHLNAASLDSQGIVLAGEVIGSDTAGPWHLLRVQLLSDENSPEVTLVSTGRIPLQVGAARLFVGSLIREPRRSLEAFPLDVTPVVWAGMWVSITAEISS